MGNLLIYAGRIALAAIFLGSGYRKTTAFGPTADVIASKGLPFPELMTVGAIACEIIGGLMVATGYRSSIGAGLLLVFLIPATWLFHPPSDPEQQIDFLKNLAIAGALLIVIGTGLRAK